MCSDVFGAAQLSSKFVRNLIRWRVESSDQSLSKTHVKLFLTSLIRFRVDKYFDVVTSLLVI